MTGDVATDLPATANYIRRSLADFARRMRSLRDNHGVSASKLSVLGRLHRVGRPLSATELAVLEGLQPQSLTRIIADLESEGFIVRRQNEHDRRQLDIALSKAGNDLLTRDARRQNEWLAGAMMHKLTPAERAILALAAELLDRLAEETVEIRKLPRTNHDAEAHQSGGAKIASAERKKGDTAVGRTNLFQNKKIEDVAIRDCSMPCSTFDDVDLSGSAFTNVNLCGAKFTDVNLAGVTIDDANIDGLRIFGYDIQSLIRAELARLKEGNQ